MMDWNELQKVATIGDRVRVVLIKPLRNGEHFLEGELCGYKSGTYGGGWYNGNKSYDSSRMRWVKKPKVLVAYNFWTFGKGPVTDWVDFDNCEFEIIKQEK